MPQCGAMHDVSGGICEHSRGNGSKEYRAAVCHICFVLNTVRMPPQHMENFSRPLEMMQCQDHKPVAGTKYFLKAESLLKMISAAEEHQQHGEVT